MICSKSGLPSQSVYVCVFGGANIVCWAPVYANNLRYLKLLGINPLVFYNQAGHSAPGGNNRHEYWSFLGHLVHPACGRWDGGVGRGLESSLKEKNRLEVHEWVGNFEVGAPSE